MDDVKFKCDCGKEYVDERWFEQHKIKCVPEPVETPETPEPVETKPWPVVMTKGRFSVISDGRSAIITDLNGKPVSKELPVDEAKAKVDRWN